MIFKIVESDPLRYAVKCWYRTAGCGWKVRVTYKAKKNVWQIMRYNCPHTCSVGSSGKDHPMLDSDFVCMSILGLVQVDSSVTAAVIRAEINNMYRYWISYKKAWKAKQKAVKKIYGDFDDSYAELPRWCAAMRNAMPGTIVEIEDAPYFNRENVEVEGKRTFVRMFWTFEPLVEAFKWCKPLVQFDGTHLYGKYKGVLMMAIAQDGNHNIIPIAFTTAEEENNESWAFFFRNLRSNVTPQEGICVISDRHMSIHNAMESLGWTEPYAFHRYCIRHIASNFMRRFNNSEAREYLINAAYSKYVRDFNYRYNLFSRHPEYHQSASDIERSKWALLYDGGHRYGHMTTNLAEYVNSVLKGMRSLPITTIVRSIFHRLASLFAQKGRDAQNQMLGGQVFSEAVRDTLRANVVTSRHIMVREFSHTHQLFEAIEIAPPQKGGLTGAYKVDLNRRVCEYGEFQMYRYPCRYVIAGCTQQHMDHEQFVADIYRLNNVANVYNLEFTPTGNEANWPASDASTLCPNDGLRRLKKGRPKSTRIRNEMDMREKGAIQLCGICRTPGHNRRHCPNRI